MKGTHLYSEPSLQDKTSPPHVPEIELLQHEAVENERCLLPALLGLELEPQIGSGKHSLVPPAQSRSALH